MLWCKLQQKNAAKIEVPAIWSACFRRFLNNVQVSNLHATPGKQNSHSRSTHAASFWVEPAHRQDKSYNSSFVYGYAVLRIYFSQFTTAWFQNHVWQTSLPQEVWLTSTQDWPVPRYPRQRCGVGKHLAITTHRIEMHLTMGWWYTLICFNSDQQAWRMKR